MPTTPPTLARAHQLRAIWDYLPAFRAVAETEHLPTAALALHVTPSSLSRAIRLAEAQIGVPLFARTGRRISLNAAGHALLGSVRTAMRVVEEGLGGLVDADLVGRVVIAASPEVSAWLAAPALAHLHAAEPGLRGELVAMPGDPAAALRRGDVDVLVAAGVPAGDGEEVEALATIRWSLFGARGQRGATRRLVMVAGVPAPAHRQLKVAAVVGDAATAAAACRHGFVAWLPAPLAVAGGLIRLAGSPSELQTIHAVWRTPVAAHGRTDAMLAALRAAATRSNVAAAGRRR